MDVTAVVNLYKGDEKITTVELEGAPLPREGEVVYLESGPYRVHEVVHDGWQKDTVSAPEIILHVTDAPNYDL